MYVYIICSDRAFVESTYPNLFYRDKYKIFIFDKSFDITNFKNSFTNLSDQHLMIIDGDCYPMINSEKLDEILTKIEKLDDKWDIINISPAVAINKAVLDNHIDNFFYIYQCLPQNNKTNIIVNKKYIEKFNNGHRSDKSYAIHPPFIYDKNLIKYEEKNIENQKSNYNHNYIFYGLILIIIIIFFFKFIINNTR